MSQTKNKLENHKQLKKKVKTNLKEINEEIKNKKEFTLHSIDTNNPVNYNSNIDNYWALPTDLSNDSTVKLGTIKNGTKNKIYAPSDKASAKSRRN